MYQQQKLLLMQFICRARHFFFRLSCYVTFVANLPLQINWRIFSAKLSFYTFFRKEMGARVSISFLVSVFPKLKWQLDQESKERWRLTDWLSRDIRDSLRLTCGFARMKQEATGLRGRISRHLFSLFLANFRRHWFIYLFTEYISQ